MLTFWIIAAVVLVGVELLTPGFLVIFFAVSALFAGITTIFTDSILIQCQVFVIAALLMIPFGRPFLQKYFKVNKEVKPSTVDALAGRTAYVTKDILPDEAGLVKFDGQIWTAKASDGEIIKTGETVKIISVDGVKVIVEKNK
jgi:membrane protein implicated in regulation of membrane protease activity